MSILKLKDGNLFHKIFSNVKSRDELMNASMVVITTVIEDKKATEQEKMAVLAYSVLHQYKEKLPKFHDQTSTVARQ